MISRGSGGSGDAPTPGLSRAPLADQEQGLTATGAAQRCVGRWLGQRGEGRGCLGLLGGWFPGRVLRGREPQRQVEQGAYAFELGATGGVQPAEAADAVEVGGQDVLEKAAQELEGLEVNVPPSAGAAAAKEPAEPALGQEVEETVAGGGLEDVAAQVLQGFLTTAHGRTVHHPALLPDLGREFRERLGPGLLQGATEEGPAAVAEGFDRQEELGAGGSPLALVEAEAAAGHQAMDMGMIFEGAGPGMEHGQQPQGGAQALGILSQVLQSLRTGRQEQVITLAGMGTDPAAQAFGHGEGDQEIGHRQ